MIFFSFYKFSSKPVLNSRISEFVGLPKGPVRIHATILSLWTSSPQEISRRSFIKKQLLFNKIGRRFARDNTNFATRATHGKVRQYAVLKGKTFTLTNGVHILQCPIKLNPALNYCNTKGS